MATGGTDGSDITLCLVEADIPGASLAEPFETHTVTELSWWLLCRGISTPKSWKKAQVVHRYVALSVVNIYLYTESTVLHNGW